MKGSNTDKCSLLLVVKNKNRDGYLAHSLPGDSVARGAQALGQA